MFNLLPYLEKQSLRKEYSYRQYAVISIALAFVVGASVLMFLPSYIYSLTQRQALEIERKTLEQAALSKSNTAVSTVQRAQHMSAALYELPDERISERLAEIISSRPVGISLVRFSLADSDASQMSIELQGIARNREALQAFERSLQRLPSMEGVKVPIESYARETNIPFTIVGKLKM